MKTSIFAILLSLSICLGISACVTEGPVDDVDSPSLSEYQQEVEVCSEAFGCVLTAIRDDQSWLIDTCIAVLCPAQQTISPRLVVGNDQ
jgi:hypothetical protein